MISFKGRHTSKPIILQCVLWYCSYALSYRNIEEMMAERGLNIDHSTLNRWVVHYAPKLEKAFHKKKKRPGNRWRMDETYLKVRGQWRYYYRAVDKEGNTIVFLLTAKRDTKAALRFFNKAIGRNGKPGLINIDKKGGGNKTAINQFKMIIIDVKKIRHIKRITNSMLGFKNFRCAQATLKGIELIVMLKKGQQRFSSQSHVTPVEQFYALAA